MSKIDCNRLTRLGGLFEESVQEGQIAGGNLCVLHRGEAVYYAEAGMRISRPGGRWRGTAFSACIP